MRIISMKPLREFYEQHPDAKTAIEHWHKTVKKALWDKPNDVLQYFKTADILKNNRVVFNIAQNKYRIVAMVNYPSKMLYVTFVGTHKDYNKIDAENVWRYKGRAEKP